ncbi:MAG: PQQ-dependent sugar dehydrogenase [Longimicrobiales bacterium]
MNRRVVNSITAWLSVGAGIALGGAPQVVTQANAQSQGDAGGLSSDCALADRSITVPAGFCLTVFADNLGHARHIAVAPNGVVYINTWSSKYNKLQNAAGGFVVALRDADGDGKAETVERFGTVHQSGQPGGGTGIAVHENALYVEVDNKIVRYTLDAQSLVPKGDPETVLGGLPMEGDHPMHPFAIARNGALYVNSGSMSNSCQIENRRLESPGQKPCAELAMHAGVWRYDANKRDQVFSAHERFASGMRNNVALAVNPRDAALYAATHGRDQLGDHWPRLFSDEQNSELPAEVFARISQGNDFGWPYCYFDGVESRHVMAPEYGGNGKTVGECATRHHPAVAFPAHWAPEAIAFYTGTAFPVNYRGGAFVSFHGSWNRKPTQAGFLIAFVPFADGKPTGKYEEFATGFAGPALPAEPTRAKYRPMGLAVGPDGALYVSDDTKGRVWRITATE